MTELELFAAELATTAVSDGTYLLPGWDVKRVRAALAQPASPLPPRIVALLQEAIECHWQGADGESLVEDARKALATVKDSLTPGAQPASVPAVTDAMHRAAMVYLAEQRVAVTSQHVNGALHAALAAAPQPAQAVPEHLPTAEQIRELAQEALDQIMEQAQVFASAWSLVGGRFDSGNAMSDAEDAKAELRTMVRWLADLAAETVRPVAPQPAQAKSRQQEIINSIKSALIRHEAATDAVVATAAGDDPHAATLAGIELEKAAALLATWTQPEYLRVMLAAAPAAPQPARAVVTDAALIELGRLWVRSVGTGNGPDFGGMRNILLAAPQPEALPQWQPIKTAPRDGTHILVWTDASDTVYVVCWADAAKGIRKYLTAESGAARGWHLAWDGALFDREHEPTHWMPLPAAPSAQAEPQQAADELVRLCPDIECGRKGKCSRLVGLSCISRADTKARAEQGGK